ncbi:hypothetical protein [Roseovarius rhodophyticola]|uniref:DUF2497 domain-containing protein n=1 Tax=Roseovarius rhodophyticola TaxID=3080827 RepID=A0ABZ2TIR5_9RHOB|nr:hypothetical protein [Roseovarius sp. W115]MDV2929291.1 hypothetical protein [Roseovarius sp. W115]
MSDPVSNAEIEDVLSSIRRLVSVDHRGEAGLGVKVERQDQVSHDDQDIENDASVDDQVDPADTPDVSVYADGDDAPEDTAKGIELGTTGVKLVLTPALRVNEEGGEQDPPDVDAEDQAEDKAHFSFEEPQHAEHDADDHEEHECLGEGDDPLKAPEEGSDFVRLRPEAKKDWVTSEESEDVLPKAPLAEDETWPEDELHDDSLDTELEVLSEADEAEDWTEEDLEDDTSYAEPEQPDAPLESELEARIAEVEAAVAARTEQWDPDSAEQDDYAGGEVAPLPWEDHGGDPEFTPEEHVEEVSPEEVEAIEEAVVLDEPVEPAADAFAEAMSEAASMPSEEPAPTSEPLNLADVALTDDVTEIVSDAVTESAAEAAADAAWFSEDTVIDEDTLRDLVSEIVRQELQGALGERITRNVRKLVRREIHRAMMGQDYD